MSGDVRCGSTCQYEGMDPFRCQRDVGHKDWHYTPTPGGGISWPQLPTAYPPAVPVLSQEDN